MKKTKNVSLIDYKKIDDNSIFYRSITDDEIISLGVQYYEDGKKAENIEFYEYPYLSSMKYQILISHGCIVVIENKEIVCLYKIAEKNRKSKKFLNNLNKNVVGKEIPQQKLYKPENILR